MHHGRPVAAPCSPAHCCNGAVLRRNRGPRAPEPCEGLGGRHCGYVCCPPQLVHKFSEQLLQLEGGGEGW